MNFIDLFCGCGGLSTGLEQAGWNCLLGIDVNKYAIESFSYNHPKAETIQDDLIDISVNEIKDKIKGQKVDLICGGPPCQGFSTLGKNDANDERNQLFNHFVRIVYELRPEFILLENVQGLLSESNKPTLFSIISAFDNIGYNIRYNLLNAAEFGVPQVRKRVFIVGSKSFIPFFPVPRYGEEVELIPFRTVQWAFNSLIYNQQKEAHNHEMLSTKITNVLDLERISYIPEGCCVRYQYDELKYLPKHLHYKGVEWDKMKEGRFRQARLKRLTRFRPSPTINTSRNTYYHPIENRLLTVREAASLQSFPPEFIFAGTPTQQWLQVGNAVPPQLAKALGESLRDRYIFN